jgi:hypothetical protein
MSDKVEEFKEKFENLSPEQKTIVGSSLAGSILGSVIPVVGTSVGTVLGAATGVALVLKRSSRSDGIRDTQLQLI